MKQTIHLTENDLRMIVRESVDRVLNENKFTDLIGDRFNDGSFNGGTLSKVGTLAMNDLKTKPFDIKGKFGNVVNFFNSLSGTEKQALIQTLLSLIKK